MLYWHEDVSQTLISAFISLLYRLCHKDTMTAFLRVTQKSAMEHGILIKLHVV
jgi:hypothetical protein